MLEKFDFDNTISRLNEAGLLFQVLERFKNVDLHPDKIDNPTMGIIFEELIRKFNEALNENPGEHFRQLLREPPERRRWSCRCQQERARPPTAIQLAQSVIASYNK